MILSVKIQLLLCFFLSMLSPLQAQQPDYKAMSIKELYGAIRTAYGQDDFEQAFQLSSLIFEKAEAVGWQEMKMRSLLVKSDAAEEMAKYELTDSIYTQVFAVARDSFKENTEDFILGHINRNYGRYLSRTGQLDEAEHYIKKAVDIFRKKEDEKRIYAAAVHDLGTIYSKAQRHTEAAFFLTEAKEIRAEVLGKQHKRYGTSLNNLAIVYAKLGETKKAEQYYREAMAVRKAALGAEHHRYLLTRSNFGYFFMDLGEYEKAFEWIAPVTENMKQRSGDFQRYYQGLLSTRGYLHLKLDRLDAAERDLLESKKLGFILFSEVNTSLMAPLTTLAELYQTKGEWERAEAELLQAIRINLQDSSQLASLRLSELAKLAEAELYFLNTMLSHLQQLGELYEAWSKERPDLKEKAYAVYRLALQIAERRRNELGETDDKLQLLANNAELANRAIQIQLDWHPEPHEDWRELFSIIEHNKSILLADAMKTQRAQSLIPNEIAQRERSLQNKISQQDKIIKESAKKKEQVAARELRNDLKLRLKELRKEIEAKFPRYYQLKYANITAKVEEVQGLLPAKTALLEYFVGEKASYLFWVEKNRFHIYPIYLSQDSLERQVERLRKTLSDYVYIRSQPERAGQEYRDMAYWFYQELLEPGLAQSEKLKRLIIITDGALGHLPFEVFLTKQADMKQGYAELPYLLKDYRISYNYSATLFKENATEVEREGNNQLLAMAASYEGDAGAAELRAVYYRSLRNTLQPLPAAQEEVKALSNDFEGIGLLGAAASERSFKQQAADYSLLHLAMHSVANREQPSLSSLVFTEDGDTLEDNFLQAYEIAQLQLKAQLVVLSACETGFGKFQQGEGVMSLARSFMYAGVPSVVVSLWQVSDESTSRIMQHFYQELFAGHKKDEALRTAKLRYLEEAKGFEAHPAFWAAFVQIGDARPMDLAGQRMTWWSIAALSLGGLLIGGILIRLLLRRRAQ